MVFTAKTVSPGDMSDSSFMPHCTQLSSLPILLCWFDFVNE
jgi:hypothetical protein